MKVAFGADIVAVTSDADLSTGSRHG